MDREKQDHLVVYVDGLLITGSDTMMINNLKDVLKAHFKLKYLCDLQYFLELEVARTKEGTVLC